MLAVFFRPVGSCAIRRALAAVAAPKICRDSLSLHRRGKRKETGGKKERKRKREENGKKGRGEQEGNMGNPGGTHLFFGRYVSHGFPKVGSRERIFLEK